VISPISSTGIASIGLLAQKTIQEEQTARVVGSTSRGVFLLTPHHKVIFLSYQPFRSPLTIISSNFALKLNKVQNGMTAQITPFRIEIPDARVIIPLTGLDPWTPSPPIGKPGNQEEILGRLRNVIQQATYSRKNLGFGNLLLPLIGITSPSSLTLSDQDFYIQTKTLGKSLFDGETESVISILKTLLGLGRGLTPSGDDFIMGLFLTLNRWKGIFPPIPSLSALNQRIVTTAFELTTSISANLIECATGGSADERLLAALDGIITGEPSENECTANICGWGSSSGIDALVGISVTLLNNKWLS
jgi:hypothetical protein